MTFLMNSMNFVKYGTIFNNLQACIPQDALSIKIDAP